MSQAAGAMQILGWTRSLWEQLLATMHIVCSLYVLYIVHCTLYNASLGVTHYLTPKETMDNLLYNNILWFIIYPIMLTINVTMASIQEIWQGPEYSKNILVHNLGHLWVIYASILLSGIISSILIYFQIWRPYKEEEKAKSQVICFLLMCTIKSLLFS